MQINVLLACAAFGLCVNALVAIDPDTYEGIEGVEFPRDNHNSGRCWKDNCYQAFMRHKSSASAFCATYTAATTTGTFPSFARNCPTAAAALSSGCSCFAKATPTNSVTPASGLATATGSGGASPACTSSKANVTREIYTIYGIWDVFNNTAFTNLNVTSTPSIPSGPRKVRACIRACGAKGSPYISVSPAGNCTCYHRTGKSISPLLTQSQGNRVAVWKGQERFSGYPHMDCAGSGSSGSGTSSQGSAPTSQEPSSQPTSQVSAAPSAAPSAAQPSSQVSAAPSAAQSVAPSVTSAAQSAAESAAVPSSEPSSL